MATYDDLKNRVLRLLNDPDGATITEEIIYDGIIAAHEAILSWIPNYSSFETSGSDVNNFTLPSDCYDVQAVQLYSGTFIPKASLGPNTSRGSTSSDNDWIENPRGYLSLSTDLTETPITVYYLAYWQLPSSASDSSFVIRVPRSAHQGLAYYAASISLMPPSYAVATLNAYKTKVDSGNPIQNPVSDMAKLFRQLFYEEMKLQKPYMKAFA